MLTKPTKAKSVTKTNNGPKSIIQELIPIPDSYESRAVGSQDRQEVQVDFVFDESHHFDYLIHDVDEDDDRPASPLMTLSPLQNDNPTDTDYMDLRRSSRSRKRHAPCYIQIKIQPLMFMS